jgi:ribosome-associated protein
LSVGPPDFAVVAARAADAKKGSATVVLEVGPILVIVDTFVITSGSNPRQVRTITEEVEAAVKAAGGGGPLRVEGLRDARWVLLDYGDFAVHVFLEETREYYDIERLWGDVERVDWQPRAEAGLAGHAGGAEMASGGRSEAAGPGSTGRGMSDL